MTDPQPRELQALFASAKCVFFDFDGPVCGLFHRHSSVRIADLLVGELAAGGGDPALVEEPGVRGDPLAVLKTVAGAGLGREMVARLEFLLAKEEFEAAWSAEPTDGAYDLVALLHEAQYELAVTTNNSAEAVERYLEKQGMKRYFGSHIHGRAPGDPGLLKPHPDCLDRALKSTGWTAADALMIGDSPADLEAAGALGMPFIGYAKNPDKKKALGAGVVVQELRTLTDALRVSSVDQREGVRGTAPHHWFIKPG
ncbi:HAD family hydrolase [Streptomyces sp. NBC_00385]|uniref:HAD family hydrolase n=1 Tax=Streptomyces sp. NBC_00385 TaxID=2975733 RepID=UPI002DD9A7A1|nr:HAD-IA family hydrolase [Streptomyces sp. NBC_00385]WRZ04958.1 HAD-IA family hydrolase [Streptomyces sp. NBC_00385]